MPGYKLDDDYIDVAKRIDIFRGKYPEGSLSSRILPLPEAFAERFIAVEALAYRTPDDACPGVGLAWEPVPGPTTFTKDSELMNAQTAAWGRAIVASLAADTKKGIASKDEIENRKPSAGVSSTPDLAVDAVAPSAGAVKPHQFKGSKGEPCKVCHFAFEHPVHRSRGASSTHTLPAGQVIPRAGEDEATDGGTPSIHLDAAPSVVSTTPSELFGEGSTGGASSNGTAAPRPQEVRVAVQGSGPGGES